MTNLRQFLKRLRRASSRRASLSLVVAGCTFMFSLLPAVVAQGDQPRLPSDPFARLLVRLNHAPFDFDQLEPLAKRGSSMQASSTAYESAMAPVTLVLERMTHSKTISFLGKLPFIGKHFEMAESGLETASELSHGFVRLVDLDKRHLQPLRDAILASARLRRSRRKEDLPATVKALDAAVAPLNSYEAFGERQDQKLDAYIKRLHDIDQHNFSSRPDKQKDSKAIKNAIVKLQAIRANLEAKKSEIHQVRLYTEACGVDGHAAM